MAYSSTAVHPQSDSPGNFNNSSLSNSATDLIVILLAMYAAQKSKKKTQIALGCQPRSSIFFREYNFAILNFFLMETKSL